MEIKICGMTCAEDVAQAVALGADWIGFVMYPPSPRSIVPDAAARIVREAAAGVRAVGVFVNEEVAEVRRIVDACGLAAVQLHGDADPRAFEGFPVPVWRALPVGKGTPMPDLSGRSHIDRYVVDAAVPGLYGGTGMQADWEAAACLATRARIMLAGGLTPQNVAAAVAAVRPLGVDVASGVEAAPGRKDPARLRAFIANARSASLARLRTE